MRLRIGETWLGEFEAEGECEQFIVDGLASIDEPLAVDEVVIPNDGDSIIEGRIKMPFTGNTYNDELTLRELNERYDRAGSPP